MPSITESQLRQEINQNNLGSLYVLYGAEKHTLKQAARRLMRRSGAENFPEFNLNQLPGDSGVDQINDAAEALPLMAERKCVAVADFNLDEKNTAEMNKLEELMENLPETTTLIFYYPTLLFDAKRAAKWKKFLKMANEKGYAVEFPLRTRGELCRLLMRKAEKEGCLLSKGNAERLIETVGTGLQPLLQEMEKLCAFANGQEITAEMIEQLVTKSMEATVFLLSNALMAGNYEKSLGYMDQLFYKKEEPVAILAVLCSAYVDLYRVRVALQSGVSARAPAAYGDYKGKEFRLDKAERGIKGVSLEKLRRMLALLLETDIKLKSSGADSRVIMDTLIAKLLSMAREG